MQEKLENPIYHLVSSWTVAGAGVESAGLAYGWSLTVFLILWTEVFFEGSSAYSWSPLFDNFFRDEWVNKCVLSFHMVGKIFLHFVHLCLFVLYVSPLCWDSKVVFSWKGYLPNLLETALLHQIFVFWVRYFKLWLLAYFFFL